jgi:hypothetical protein
VSRLDLLRRDASAGAEKRDRLPGGRPNDVNYWRRVDDLRRAAA